MALSFNSTVVKGWSALDSTLPRFNSLVFIQFYTITTQYRTKIQVKLLWNSWKHELCFIARYWNNGLTTAVFWFWTLLANTPRVSIWWVQIFMLVIWLVTPRCWLLYICGVVKHWFAFEGSTENDGAVLWQLKLIQTFRCQVPHFFTSLASCMLC